MPCTDKKIHAYVAERSSCASKERSRERGSLPPPSVHGTETPQDLVAIVSHDLRCPLQLIFLKVDVVRRQLSADSSASPLLGELDRISEAADRMNRLISDLLDCSSIEAGSFAVSYADVDCRALIADAVEALAPLAHVKGLTLRGRVECAGTLRCDRDRIQQALSNLIANAIKFTPPGGEIEITCADQDGEVCIAVADSGPGIAPEEQSHLFERYWRARRGPGGVGLGLYIARTIVEAHGGRIWFESDVGRGSTFSFALPIC